MRSILPAIVVTCSCLAWSAGGCGGSEDPLPLPEVEVTLANLCDEMAEVSCYNMFTCCTGEQIEDVLGIAISLEPADCRRDMALLCQERFAPILWAAQKGSVGVDTLAIGGCLQLMLVRGACFEHVSTIPWEEACEADQVVGTVQPGGACVYGWECANGGFCAPDARCVALPGPGQECDDVCAAGLFCNRRTYRCENQLGSGQACNDSSFCQAGLFCKFDGEGAGACTSPRAVGQPCEGDQDCATSYCQPGVCAGSTLECFENSDCPGQCVGSDSSCFSDYDCGSRCSISHDPCYSDYDCTEGGSCVPDTCDQQGCSGQPVCAERWLILDYCEGTLGMFLGED
ncbi:MAG TPA: hypothetical protein PK668_18215 [Myxococcota bacterium]|nr:hypothetical protein [Myxococcota bacterium]HRY95899.1 hypothetical protein [Myxococcota bacterium]HSA24615.1 hypothetical protein [Myxococcota bacterium]